MDKPDDFCGWIETPEDKPMGKDASPHASTDGLVERLRLDNPRDYLERHEEMLSWTGSAFLAGEPVDDEMACKGALYSFLCGTLGYFVAAEDTARNGQEAADRFEQLTATLADRDATIGRMREALGKAIETLSAGQHLLGKYTPEHHWMDEHHKRIAELKAALDASATDHD